MVRRVKQPHEAQYLNGNGINWHNPPAPYEKVKWSKKTTGGHDVTGSFRTICHLNRLNNLAIKKYGSGVEVIQPPYNTGVAASAGTHDLDCCFDVYIPGVDWWDQQRFFRANGCGGWYRHPPLFGNHCHMFTLPVPEGHVHSDDFRMEGTHVGLYVDGGWSTRGYLASSSQIDDYYNHAFGLANAHGAGSDRSWFPADINATIFNLRKYVHRRRRLADAA